jgi:hypothetical protein
MREIYSLYEEDLMPAQSNNTSDQNKAADEAARTARTVADEAGRVGEQTARAGADVYRPCTVAAPKPPATVCNRA